MGIFLSGGGTCPALVYPLATIIHIPPTCKIYILLHFQDSPEVASCYGFRLRPKVKGLGPVIFLTQNTAQGRLLKDLHQSGKARGPGPTTGGKLGQLPVPLPVFCFCLGSMLGALASTF